MLRVYACLTGQHDLRLVFLAALICIAACLISMNIFVRANDADRNQAFSWLFVAATVFGAGVWATHFIAELAFEPGFAIGYDAGLTVLSFVAAIGAAWLGMFVAHRYTAPMLSGAMIGAGIAAMHYIGMAALRAPAQLHWDTGYVLASVAIAMTFAAAAMQVSSGGPALRGRVIAALLLVLAIVGLHFTAMTAVILVPDPLIAVPGHAVAPTILAFAIATVTALIAGLGLLGLILDKYLALRAAREAERLRRSEDHLARAQRIARTGSIEQDLQTGAIEWFGETYRIFGLDPNLPAPVGEAFLALFHPDDRAAAETQWLAHQAAGRPHDKPPISRPFRIVQPGGAVRWIHNESELVLDQHGEAVRWIGTYRDVTETLEAEESFRLLFESNPVSMWLFDPESMQFLAVNDAAVVLYGYDKELFLTMTLLDVLPEKDRGAVANAIRSTPHLTGADASHRWQHVKADGTQIDVHTYWRLTTFRERRAQLVAVVDVTGQRKAAEQLKSSEETFRTAMDYAPIGMALGDPDGRWIKVNKALCDLLGYEQDELLTRDFQSITHADDLEADLGYLRKLLADDIKTYQLEKRFYHKSGQIVWVLLSVSLLRTANGKPNYLIKQVQDITERKEMERMKSEFISMVSHELRTPLTSIRGALGLMVGTMTKDLPEKANRLIDIAHKNSKRLIMLINDMLDIDKIASGQMRFDIKQEALSPLIWQAVETNQPYADKFGVSITMLPVDAELHVNVDSARLSQVFANLLSNAAKFSNQGDKIEIAAMLSGNKVRISVKDHGPGIAEEFCTRIFAKFSQANSSATRIKGGTGLGLHISKQIIENMGGQIGFETEIGKGSIFWIEFPIAVNQEDASPSSSLNGSKASLLHYKEHHSDSPVVLHVEDDFDLSHVLAAALHGKVDVITAPTLRQAERLLKLQKFDMIVLDIGMPDGSGLSLLEKLPELTDPLPPVVILSAREIPKEVQLKVAASLVKSRVLETKIVETILQLLGNRLLASSDTFCVITGESAA